RYTHAALLCGGQDKPPWSCVSSRCGNSLVGSERSSYDLREATDLFSANRHGREKILGATMAFVPNGRNKPTQISAGRGWYLMKLNPFQNQKERAALVRTENLLFTRPEMINRLSNEDFDVLIVGGGVTGAYAALDAVLRG